MAPNGDSMGKEERRLAVLQFLDETDVALLPASIFLNMEERGATFSENTVKRHLYEMRDEGLVEKPWDGRDHYRITEDGRKYLRESQS